MRARAARGVRRCRGVPGQVRSDGQPGEVVVGVGDV
jgi:hypothetical protein